ncbi:MAG: chromate efflux transporter [Athalassotoga sp.]
MKRFEAFFIKDEKKISVFDIFITFFKIGLTAFGAAMMTETKKSVVMQKKWVEEREFLNGLSLAQFLPGATFVSLTVFLGYQTKRLSGAFASFLGLLLPPFGLMVLLSYLYFTYGNIPTVNIIFTGLKALVVALIANALFEIGKSIFKNWQAVLIAIAAFGVAWLNVNIFFILIIASILGIILYRPWSSMPKKVSNNNQITFKSNIKEIIITLAVVGGVFLISALSPILLKLEEVFFWIGLLVFGNGYTMIPVIQQQVVNMNHWLTPSQFMVGIALGQVTPGPIVITATFIGYKVAGILGSIAATVGVFTPCLLLVITLIPIYVKIKENSWVKVVLNGVVASFIGLITLVLIDMISNNLTTPLTIILAISAFLVLRFTKLNTLWVLLGGTGIYFLIAQFIR